MANKTFGPKIAVDGEKQFKDAISGINKDLRVLDSEMKKVTEEFRGNENSVQSLTAKSKILNDQIESQEDKVTLLKIALAKANEEYGEGSTKSKDYQIKLNGAETQLAKLNNELKENSVKLESAKDNTNELKSSVSRLGAETSETKAKTSQFGDTLKANFTTGAIVAGIMAIAQSVKAVGNAAWKSVRETTAYADEIMTMSNNTGIAIDTLQELTYMQELTDVSTETVTSTMAKNIKSMYNAQKGLTDNVDAYKKLGVSITDANGELRDSETVYWEAIDALGNMSNETERDATAMVLFGKSAQDLNSVIKIGSEGVAQYSKEAQDMGAVLSDDVIESLVEADNQFQIMEQKLQVIQRQFGITFAPAITRGADELIDVLEDMSDELEEIGEDAIETLVDSLSFLIEHLDIVLASIKGLTVGFLTFKGINLGSNLISSFTSLRTSINGAKTAQQGLNTAMNSNPIGVVAIAVSGLIGLMTILNDVFGQTAGDVDQLSDDMKTLTSDYNDLNSAVESARENRETTFEDIELETAATKELVDKLFELNENQELTNGQKATMKGLIEELNSLYPNLNLQLDEETGHIEDSKDAIYEKIEAMKEEATQQAIQESLVEVQKEIMEQEKLLATQSEERAALIERLNANLLEQQELYITQKASAKSVYDVWKDGKEQLEAYDKSVEDASYSLETNQIELQALYDMMDSQGTMTYEEAIQKQYDLNDSTDESASAVERSSGKMQKANEDAGASFGDLANSADIKSELSSHGTNAASGFSNAFTTAWNGFLLTADTLVNKLPAGIKRVLKINSPSKVTEDLGEFTGEGFEVGAVKSFTKAQEKLQRIISASVNPTTKFSSSVAYNTNVNSTDYSPILTTMTQLLQEQKNMKAAITVIVGQKAIEKAVKNISLSKSMQDE